MTGKKRHEDTICDEGNDFHPLVSVIIPVFNDFSRLLLCLTSLRNQSYPKDYYEIIVVDNNSTSFFNLSHSEFGEIKLCFEATPGSYAARNKGISVAKGDIFAFIDSDCVAQKSWIANGVAALESASAHLVGGQVTFILSPQRTPAEIYDSLTNMQIERNIAERKVSKTANLFVRREIFDSVGLFPQHLKSGGDVAWTKKATDSGHLLAYSKEAEVFHPARKLPQLLKKQFRVGKGQTTMRLAEGQTLKKIAIDTIFCFKYPRIQFLTDKIEPKYEEEVMSRPLAILLVIWLCNISTGLGRFTTILIKLVTSLK
ncbi:glycosyltransferase [Romeria aff. gracilis LEGE 07310]|uniref:Glycosyltransferase n=1 Tax=Vasconcelosia minhoensis LEGE 07310 TaxID=915328 RepID=A0A8J7DKF2_9CYAN|nr:glycosyltransferase [Romeria gracilis]MBE9076326.1 glycosyltransferase [Romeria aff. gracilis LEGE 07310]